MTQELYYEPLRPVYPDCNTFATPIIVNPDEQLNNKILGSGQVEVI